MTVNIGAYQQVAENGWPIWILVLGALLCLVWDCFRSKFSSAAVFVTALLTLIGSTVAAWAQWTSGQGLSAGGLLVIDLQTVFFILLVNMVGILTLLNGAAYLKLHRNLSGEFSALVLFSIIGMIFFFASDHLVMNFIGLETMSMAIYVLVGSHTKNVRSNEASLKYFIMGGVASAFFLYGISLYWGHFQTFQLASLATVQGESSLLPKLALGFLLVGVFFKLALAPFHFWAPDVYEGAPAPVTGFMATGVKIATMGFAVRLFLGLQLIQMPQLQSLIVMVVILSLIGGNLLALVQEDVKRVLAYSSVSHAGFLLLGLLAGFENGQYQLQHAKAVFFYLIGYMFMSLGAFGVLSLMVGQNGEATRFEDLNGLGRKNPVLAAILTIFMLSMIGLPPTVGFAAKYSVLSLAVQNGHGGLALLGVIASIISAFYYLRPSVHMYFRSEDQSSIDHVPLAATVAVSICLVVVVYLGVFPAEWLDMVELATIPLAR